MAPLVVDPEALFGAGSAVVAAGDGLGAGLTILAGGFAALLFSQLRGNIFMGLLMALIMITSSAFAVTLLPALLVLAKPSFARKREIAKHKETT